MLLYERVRSELKKSAETKHGKSSALFLIQFFDSVFSTQFFGELDTHQTTEQAQFLIVVGGVAQVEVEPEGTF